MKDKTYPTQPSALTKPESTDRALTEFSFSLIPAIDIKAGQCVRLKQGRMDDSTIFFDDPREAAAHWHECQTQRLHLVDLDGAFAGKPVNHQVIADICRRFEGINIQVGGGIRTIDDLDMLMDIGVNSCILGTAAVKNPTFVHQACERYPQQMILGIDAKNGWVATEGWADQSSVSVIDLTHQFKHLDLAEIIYTDINRDGMLTGINIKATCQLANEIPFKVIASGGAHSIDDIKQLASSPEAKAGKISGMIAGRSIYTGDIDFKQALAWLEQIYPG